MSELVNSLRKNLIDSPQIVSSTFTTEPIDIGDRETAFAVQIVYSNGNGSVDMDLVYEVSVNGTDYVAITDDQQTITDDSGTHIWDISDTGVGNFRVSVVVRTGEVQIDSIFYNGKKRN